MTFFGCNGLFGAFVQEHRKYVSYRGVVICQRWWWSIDNNSGNGTKAQGGVCSRRLKKNINTDSSFFRIANYRTHAYTISVNLFLSFSLSLSLSLSLSHTHTHTYIYIYIYDKSYKLDTGNWYAAALFSPLHIP